jgi:hypothetical protein
MNNLVENIGKDMKIQTLQEVFLKKDKDKERYDRGCLKQGFIYIC